MDIKNIMNADLLDIIFEGKNKEYGAYQLRKTYNKRVVISITGMAAFCLLFFLTQILASGKDKIRNTITVTDVNLATIKEKTPEPIQVKPPKAALQKVATSQYTPPLFVKDIDVKDLPPAMDKLEETQIGLINQDGVKDLGFAAPPVEASTGVVEAIKKPAEEDYERTFIKVETEARFPGGPEAWKRYLERNLNANVAADDGAATGYYIVKVQFIVDKEGNISNVQAIEVPKACPSCGPEAVKIIKKGPKWEPAIQNARRVNYQAVQIVTFQVAEE